MTFFAFFVRWWVGEVVCVRLGAACRLFCHWAQNRCDKAWGAGERAKTKKEALGIEPRAFRVPDGRAATAPRFHEKAAKKRVNKNELRKTAVSPRPLTRPCCKRISLCSLVAERQTCNLKVLGSIPSEGSSSLLTRQSRKTPRRRARARRKKKRMSALGVVCLCERRFEF